MHSWYTHKDDPQRCFMLWLIRPLLRTAWKCTKTAGLTCQSHSVMLHLLALMTFLGTVSLVTFHVITSKSPLNLNQRSGLISKERWKHLQSFGGPLIIEAVCSSLCSFSMWSDCHCFFLIYFFFLSSGQLETRTSKQRVKEAGRWKKKKLYLCRLFFVNYAPYFWTCGPCHITRVTCPILKITAGSELRVAKQHISLDLMCDATAVICKCRVLCHLMRSDYPVVTRLNRIKYNFKPWETEN